jgi:hypothetical protein
MVFSPLVRGGPANEASVIDPAEWDGMGGRLACQPAAEGTELIVGLPLDSPEE